MFVSESGCDELSLHPLFYFLTFFSLVEIKNIKNNEGIDDKYDSDKLTTERKRIINQEVKQNE